MESGAASPQMLTLIIDPKAHHSLFPPRHTALSERRPKALADTVGYEAEVEEDGAPGADGPSAAPRTQEWAEGDRTGNMGDWALPRTVSAGVGAGQRSEREQQGRPGRSSSVSRNEERLL